MNYFAHGYRHLDDPYFLAGTAVPDWLNVVDRRVRARAKGARPLCNESAREPAAVARGIVRHHDDDRWFHQTRAFAELSFELTVVVRDALAPDEGFRPSFLGHVLVEVLLDATLIERAPGRLERYYDALRAIDPGLIASTVAQVAGRPVPLLAELIPRFIEERFLPDYLDDAKLLHRLNQVLRRVRLMPLPGALSEILPVARAVVAARADDLLTPPVQGQRT